MRQPYPHSSPSPVIGESCRVPRSEPPGLDLTAGFVGTQVVGAGCVGLTSAIDILKNGLPVLLLARHLPGDDPDAEFASTAAGAHHLSFASNSDWRQRYLDLRTFEKLWQQSENAEEGERIGVMRLTQTEYYRGDTHLRLLEQLPNFRINAALPEDIDHSVSFESVTIEPARYLPYLLKTFEKLGGVICRTSRLESLAEARGYAERPMCVVNCTGLGSSKLVDVQDTTVHPVRGQVVVLDCPWVKTGWTRQIGSLAGGEGGERTYVIPRASGEVVVGGTREVDDWMKEPRAETTADILRRALEICPSLARPPNSTTPVPLETLVKSVVVGFRPTRDEGIRLEAETLSTRNGELKVVHNYGHGGYGWQSAWGCSEEVARIVGDISRSSGSRVSKL